MTTNRNKFCYCGASCYFEKSDEPCWGEVEAIDEYYSDDGDYEWIHACQGHKNCSFGSKYIYDSRN